MSNLKYCIARRKAEIPAFIRVLKAVPQKGLKYRADPKARTAQQLAWLFAAEEAALLKLLEKGKVDWKETKPPAKIAAIVRAYKRSSTAVTKRLERLTEVGWRKKVSFIMGEGKWEDTLANMVWGFFFDAIHHRGQLSTYLRPMGSKVPSIYGPSADDPGM